MHHISIPLIICTIGLDEDSSDLATVWATSTHATLWRDPLGKPIWAPCQPDDRLPPRALGAMPPNQSCPRTQILLWAAPNMSASCRICNETQVIHQGHCARAEPRTSRGNFRRGLSRLLSSASPTKSWPLRSRQLPQPKICGEPETRAVTPTAAGTTRNHRSQTASGACAKMPTDAAADVAAAVCCCVV